MALEAVVFPQDLFSYGCKDLYSLAAAMGCHDFKAEREEDRQMVVGESMLEMGGGSGFDSLPRNWEVNSPSPETMPDAGAGGGGGRRKRRRTRACKNKEEVENQRMTHIAVERNRRKQMNEYLAVLRSLMPASYVQRGDQASIIGGAINFVKELEQLLQSLEAQKRMAQKTDSPAFPSPFADFFSFPQFTTCSAATSGNETVAENRSAIADIEVTMVESHASLKIFSQKRPKQLLKMVAGFHHLHLTVLHLNVTTLHQMALYSLSVKVEDDCGLASVDEIAAAVHQMLEKIQEDQPPLAP